MDDLEPRIRYRTRRERTDSFDEPEAAFCVVDEHF
jgi:hypothetical protein